MLVLSIFERKIAIRIISIVYLLDFGLNMNFSSRITNLRNTIRVIYEYRLDSIVYFFSSVFDFAAR